MGFLKSTDDKIYTDLTSWLDILVEFRDCKEIIKCNKCYGYVHSKSEDEIVTKVQDARR